MHCQCWTNRGYIYWIYVDLLHYIAEAEEVQKSIQRLYTMIHPLQKAQKSAGRVAKVDGEGDGMVRPTMNCIILAWTSQVLHFFPIINQPELLIRPF